MKKLERKREPVRRLLTPSELATVRGGDGGITAQDDWESRNVSGSASPGN